MQQECSDLRDTNQRIQAELVRQRDLMRTDSNSWEREKGALVADYEARTARISVDREEQAAKAQSELRAKIAELNFNFESTVKNMEKGSIETLRQELEGIRLRDLTAARKHSALEVEAVRSEERKSGVREVEQVRATFRERERQTSEDLGQLERLHGERVSRLEKKYDALKQKLEEAEGRAKKASGLASKGSADVRKLASSQLKQAEEQAKRAEVLFAQLSEAQQELQTSRVREAAYRDQLGRVLEEARLQRAQLLEAQRQLSSGSLQTYKWQRAAKEADVTQASAASSLQIAREEIGMLEHEMARLREANWNLSRGLERADKLVYGTFAAGAVATATATAGGNTAASITNSRTNKNSGHSSSSSSSTASSYAHSTHPRRASKAAASRCSEICFQQQ